MWSENWAGDIFQPSGCAGICSMSNAHIDTFKDTVFFFVFFLVCETFFCMYFQQETFCGAKGG